MACTDWTTIRLVQSLGLPSAQRWSGVARPEKEKPHKTTLRAYIPVRPCCLFSLESLALQPSVPFSTCPALRYRPVRTRINRKRGRWYSMYSCLNLGSVFVDQQREGRGQHRQKCPQGRLLRIVIVYDKDNEANEQPGTRQERGEKEKKCVGCRNE